MRVITAGGRAPERASGAEDALLWNEAKLAARFESLVSRVGGHFVKDVFTRLHAAWGAPERRYHDLEHLSDCLRELGAAQSESAIADIAELALWYHDAVYDPLRHDSEERSAARLRADARILHIDNAVVEAAVACIRATAHVAGATPSGSAAELVVDIDLAILGRESRRFMDFEYKVAEEYAAIPWPKYVQGRGRFLSDLLARPSIFRTEHFRARYQQSARSNIARLLASPRYASAAGFLGPSNGTIPPAEERLVAHVKDLNAKGKAVQ